MEMLTQNVFRRMDVCCKRRTEIRILRGLYSGDGYATRDEAGIDLINDKLIEDIQTLLLIDGIRGRARDSGKMRSMRISDLEGLKRDLKKNRLFTEVQTR